MARSGRDIPRPRQTATPTLAVTMGDPGGIGPEIVCGALSPALRRGKWAGTRFVVHGSGSAMHRAAEVLGLEPYWWRVERGSPLIEAAQAHDVVLIDSDAEFGTGETRFEHAPTKLGGELSFLWVNDAIEQAKLDGDAPGRADGIVTAPISKAAWDLAAARSRSCWPGHTELLASRFRVDRFCMMFEGPRLRVTLATIHLPLMDVRDVLTIGRVFDAIDLGAEGCRQLGIERPRIAVCGLNPHAGEGGLLGDEEERLIKPAIRVAQEQGLDVSGPWPGDTVFNAAVGGRFDLVVAMYHDQGLIPVKLLARDQSVNMTVGLPTVRTSPDHGTAFDIAGRGVADPGSMVAAIDAAVRLLRPV